MVEQLCIDIFKCSVYQLGYFYVLLARQRHAARVIVRNGNAYRSSFEYNLHDITHGHRHLGYISA